MVIRSVPLSHKRVSPTSIPAMLMQRCTVNHSSVDGSLPSLLLIHVRACAPRIAVSCRNRGSCGAGPGCGDVARAPSVASDGYRSCVDHDDPACRRSVAWPAGQEPSVEVAPRDAWVTFEQPLGHSVPGEGIEVAEGRLGHPCRKYAHQPHSTGLSRPSRSARP